MIQNTNPRKKTIQDLDSDIKKINAMVDPQCWSCKEDRGFDLSELIFILFNYFKLKYIFKGYLLTKFNIYHYNQF